MNFNFNVDHIRSKVKLKHVYQCRKIDKIVRLNSTFSFHQIKAAI